MKISLVIPEKIKSVFLLNPACFRLLSFGIKNLYYNILPVISTTENHIHRFLDEIVFYKPNHTLSNNAEKLLVEYLMLAISNYKDKNDKPYNMVKELKGVQVDIHLLVGEKDILFPPRRSINNARAYLQENLKSIKIFEEVGHGIECYQPCIEYMKSKLMEYIN